MKFKSQVRPSQTDIYSPHLNAKSIWLYILVVVPIVINSLVTMGLIKRFMHGQSTPAPASYITENYAHDISERVVLSLEKIKTIDDIRVQNNTSELAKRLNNKYLSDIPVDKTTQILVVNQSGKIITSNVKDPQKELIFKSQEMLINLRDPDSNSSSLNQLQKLNLYSQEQHFLGVIRYWHNQQLGLNWYVLVAVPIPIPENSSDLSHQNISYYLLLVTFLGTLASVGLVFLASKFKLSANSESILSHPKNQEQEQEREQKLLPSSKSNMAIAIDRKKKEARKAENLPEYEPYLLLADMSHELRSPLNAILGFAQIIEQELTNKTETNQENITIINRSGTRLLEIINDLVDLAKLETKKLTLERNEINLDSWLDTLEQSFNFQAARQDWNFLLIRQPDIPQGICTDERRLKQIMRSLIDYCVNSQPNAQITLSVSLKQDTAKPHSETSSTTKQKQTVCFTVTNSNCKVSAEEIDSLFKPLIRVKKAHKPRHGSSLNLPISRHLAKLMEGDITVNSQTSDNAGITFDFRLKTKSIAVRKLQHKSTVRRIIGLESSPIKYRILIVDDSKANRKIMSYLLTPVGFEVQEAVNGKEAIDVWLRWQPHMIWMDLRMPVMNGYEATERIKSHAGKPHTPIVGLSATTLEEEKSLFWAAGCDDFVGKPFSENTIFDKIAQHLDIRYVYESIPDPEPNNYRLTKDSLNVMPNLWLSQLEQAATALNQDLVIQLLQEISSENVDLKDALLELVNKFEFDRILSLTQTSKNN